MFVIEVQNHVDQTWRPAFGTRAEKTGIKVSSNDGEWLRHTILPVFAVLDEYHEFRVTEYGPIDTRGAGIRSPAAG